MLKNIVSTCKKFIVIVLFAFTATQTDADNDIERLRDHVTYLASDKLCGRLPTTKGEERAARYVAKQYKKYGLSPIPSLNSFFQTEPLPTDLVELSRNTLLLVGNKHAVQLTGKELAFLNAKSEIQFNGTLEPLTDRALFTELHSLEGKIAVIDFNDTPFFDQFPDTGTLALLKLSAAQAEKRGAEALFISSDSTSIFSRQEDGSEHEMQSRAKILHSVFGHLTMPFAILKKEVWEDANKIGSQNLLTIKHTSSNKLSYGEYTNVVGMIKGRSNKAIVIGAHFDHIGAQTKRTFSCSDVYNGADDNASGTAVLLELAKRFAQSDTPPEHHIIFAAFSAEELGLVGSKALAEHLVAKHMNIDAMVNFDMLGHPNRAVEVKGAELSLGWTDWFETNADSSDPTTIKKAGFFYRSDHGSFIEKKIPSVIFSTWIHDRYHRTTDEIAHVNFAGMQRILNKSEAFIQFVDNKQENRYQPQIRMDITQWKIGDFDVISSLYNGSFLNHEISPFTSSAENLFEWDIGFSEPPRKTALTVSQLSEEELLIRINRYENFEATGNNEQHLLLGEKALLKIPANDNHIEIELKAISQ